jgi:hypothetical protein
MASEQRRQVLTIGGSVTLNASGTGTVSLGPDSARGPATWRVDGVILQTNRPGQAPIPRAVVYLDEEATERAQGLSYDGSFAQGRCNLTVTRGQKLVCTWTGGQAGDQAVMTLTGEKW